MERLVHIRVERLFGYLNQDIELAVDEGVTILHGANGSGKTTILRAIRELSHRVPVQLSQVPFSRFVLDYQSGLSIVVDNASSDYCEVQQHPSHNSEPWRFPKKDIERWFYKLRRRGPRSHREHEMFMFMHQFEDVPPNEWIEMAQHLPVDLPLDFGESPPWLERFWSSFQCTLIEEQRLLRLEPFRERPAPRIRRAVTDYSEHLQELINGALRQYAQKSQQLERSFPQRMVRSFAHPAPSPTDITERYEELDKLRTDLRRVSLVEPESHIPPLEEAGLQDEHVRQVLALYAEDLAEKLSLFGDLHSRITLFTDLINNYFTHKSVHISREGIRFQTEAEDMLDPASLSSGEQHILVLFFSLLFKSPSTPHLVLIDEPELSLHPRWQLRLVDDLVKIRELSQTDFILASHSPQIFQGHWEMARDLEI